MTKIIALFMMMSILSGCSSKSLNFVYNADMPRLPNASILEQYMIGVAKFDDKRAWVEKGNKQSESYISSWKTAKLGLSYKGDKYVAVNEIIQDLLVQELTKAGFKAMPIDTVITKTNIKNNNSLGKDKKYNYLVGGQLLVFDFMNEPSGLGGMMSLTPSRNVSLSLNIFSGDNNEILSDSILTESDRDVEESIGIRFSDNVDKLMNIVFKKVAQQIIQKVEVVIPTTR